MTAMMRISRHGVPWVTMAVSAVPAAVLLSSAFLLHQRSWVMGLAQAGFLLLALPAAFVLDEPAAPAVDATPRSPWVVLGARLGATLALAAVVAALAWAWNARRASPQGWVFVLVPTALMLGALAGATLLRRWGRVSPGEVVASGVAVVAIGMLLFAPEWRGVSALPGPGEVEPRDVVAWTALMLVSGAVVLVLPASRGARPAVDT